MLQARWSVSCGSGCRSTYSSALMVATVIRPAPVATLTMSSPACTEPSSRTRRVEARATVAGQQRGHPRLTHADADPVARHSRLSDLEQGGADAILVADAYLVVAKPVDGEVLTELAEDEVVALQAGRASSRYESS